MGTEGSCPTVLSPVATPPKPGGPVWDTVTVNSITESLRVPAPCPAWPYILGPHLQAALGLRSLCTDPHRAPQLHVPLTPARLRETTGEGRPQNQTPGRMPQGTLKCWNSPRLLPGPFCWLVPAPDLICPSPTVFSIRTPFGDPEANCLCDSSTWHQGDPKSELGIFSASP